MFDYLNSSLFKTEREKMIGYNTKTLIFFIHFIIINSISIKVRITYVGNFKYVYDNHNSYRKLIVNKDHLEQLHQVRHQALLEHHHHHHHHHQITLEVEDHQGQL